MIMHTKDADLIATLLLSGWTRSAANEFFWPTNRMPRC